MDNRGEEKTPFDERTTLEDLERFRQEIAHYRARRNALGEEFDQFIRSFKTPGPVPEPQAPAVPASATRAEQSAEPSGVPPALRNPERGTDPITPASPSVDPLPEEVTSVAGIADFMAEVATPSMPAPEPPAEPLMPPVLSVEPAPELVPPTDESITVPPAASPELPVEVQAHKRSPVLAGGMLILAVVIGLAAWSFWPDRSEPSIPPAPLAPAAVPPEAALTGTAPAEQPARPEPSGSELTTSRAVWVRVIADGERVLERELPADARVPLAAEKTLVIRTGDAGAVRLSIAGQDQGTLGEAGEVVTRTFKMPAHEPPVR